MPTLNIFAGINGAGKSTLYNYLKINSPETLICEHRVNPDEILCRFCGNPNSRADMAKSGKIAIELINKYLTTKTSFNWETTILSGFALHVIETAKEKGYRVCVHFIGVEKLEQSLARIKKRVLCGGHNIPDEIVEARFRNQFKNLYTVKNLADKMFLYDNSKFLKIVGTVINHKLTYTDAKCEWVKQVAEDLSKD